MIPGPRATAQGATGRIVVGGLVIGHLTSWKLVISPTTGAPTLIGEGAFERYFMQAVGMDARAEVMPKAQPYRIGRPKPPKAQPMTIVGKLFQLTPGRVTISEGEIQADG